MLRYIRNNRGVAMMTVLMVLALLLVIGSIILDMTSSERRMVYAYGNNARAFYIAEAGADFAIQQWQSYITNNLQINNDLSKGPVGKLDLASISDYQSQLTSSIGNLTQSLKSTYGTSKNVNISFTNWQPSNRTLNDSSTLPLTPPYELTLDVVGTYDNITCKYEVKLWYYLNQTVNSYKGFGTATVDTSQDTTPPMIVSTTPANSATNVSNSQVICVNFSEPIFQDDANYGNIRLLDSNNNLVTFMPSISGDTLYITPSVNLANNTQYTVIIPPGVVQDAASNSFLGNYSFRFSTGGNIPINVTGTNLTSTGVSVNPVITVTFNQNVLIDNANNIKLTDSDGNQVGLNLTLNGNTLTVNPQTTLSYSTGYTLSLLPGAVQDQSGNPMSSLWSRTFETVADSFIDFLINNNVFVYGSNLSVSGSTQVSQNGDQSTIVITNNNNGITFNGNNDILTNNIYINDNINFTSSTHLGEMNTTKLIYINGNVILGNGGAQINGDTVYINGNVTFTDSAIINANNLYINGSVTFKNWSATIKAGSYYIGGTISINDNNPSHIIGTKINSAPTFPLFPDFNVSDTSLRQDSWYSKNGYVSGGNLANNIKIFSSGNYSFNASNTYSNIIIVSKGDISLSGWMTVSGVLYAPNGKVSFGGASFTGVVIAKNGFYVTNGGSNVTFVNITNYISNLSDYPFQ